MVRIGTFERTEKRNVDETGQNQATDKWTNDEGWDVMVRKNSETYSLLVNDPHGNVFGGKEEELFQGSADTVNRVRGEAAEVMRAIADGEFEGQEDGEDEDEEDDEDEEEAEPVEA